MIFQTSDVSQIQNTTDKENKLYCYFLYFWVSEIKFRSLLYKFFEDRDPVWPTSVFLDLKMDKQVTGKYLLSG